MNTLHVFQASPTLAVWGMVARCWRPVRPMTPSVTRGHWRVTCWQRGVCLTQSLSDMTHVQWSPLSFSTHKLHNILDDQILPIEMNVHRKRLPSLSRILILKWTCLNQYSTSKHTRGEPRVLEINQNAVRKMASFGHKF